MVSIPPSICSKVGNVYGKAMKYRKLADFVEKGVHDKAAFAAKLMVISFISKDAVNCLIYTTQSATNEKIPKEKRSFVMYNDLINGFLNVGGQLLSMKLVERAFLPKAFGTKYSGTLKNPVTKNEGPLGAPTDNAKLYADNLQDIIKGVLDPSCVTKKTKSIVEKIKAEIGDVGKFSAEELKVVVPQAMEKLSSKIASGSSKFGSIETGFGIIVGALATTALIKRTLVPLISTPLAGYFSDRANKKLKQKEESMTPAMINSTMPKVGEDNKKLNKTV